MNEENLIKTQTFEDLYNRDIKKYVEKLRKDYKDKQGNKRFFELSYLSWAYGHREMKRIDPNAKEEIVTYPLEKNGVVYEQIRVPYLQTPQGFFVTHRVTIHGRIEEETLPVLDQSNQPLPNPNSFQINNSNKRCFVKALAKHGLGLYLYVGEDLPEDISTDQPQSQDPSGHTNNQPTQSQQQSQQPSFKDFVRARYADIKQLVPDWDDAKINELLKEKAKVDDLRKVEQSQMIGLLKETINEIKTYQKSQTQQAVGGN